MAIRSERSHPTSACPGPGQMFPTSTAESDTIMLFRVVARRVIPLSALVAAGMAGSGCAEIEKASPEEAVKLAEIRADLDKDKALEDYTAQRKREIVRENKDPDSIDDYQNPEAGKQRLAQEARFLTMWKAWRTKKFESEKETYKALSADVVRKCTDVARVKQSAVEVDTCVKQAPEAKYDPIRALLLAALAIVGCFGALMGYRATRRRIDPVAQAGKKLGLGATQAAQQTTLTGEFKGYSVKVEASAPEVGQGDGYLRVLILTKVDAHTQVRFGPLAPPTGLDLPDLDAPEVHDPRIPEGYKMRLSVGADGEPMLSGDIGFQLRAFDPADIRVHDGMAGLTCWQVPQSADKVIEFMDLALAVAKQYPQR